jgi:L-2-hydroxyglutarate oxidase LhgO
LWSPSTGIVDSHALMLALLADAEAAGATLALTSRVADGEATSDGIALRVVAAGDDPFTIEASCVVNCASLDASRIARSINGVPPDTVPDTHLVKGNYFTLNARAPFSHLVYPVPGPGSLGIHLALDLAGQARFGPDVEWLEPGAALDYEVDERRANAFAASIRRYWPRLPDDALAPAYAGIRPRLSAPGQPLVDFDFRGPGDHGVAGLVNLFGIESPGLTSSLAIAEHVVGMLA